MTRRDELLIFLISSILCIAAVFPTLSIGSDPETTIGFIHPFFFGHRDVNPLTELAAGHDLPFALKGTFRPLYYLNFNFDYLLYGTGIIFYRLENLLWMLVIPWLLLQLGYRLGLRRWQLLAMGCSTL